MRGWEDLQPSTRVIGLETDNQVPTLIRLRVERHERGVAARWVVELENDIVAVGTRALREHQRIMAVEMDGVGKRHWGLDDDVHPLLELGDLDGEVAGVAGDRVVPVDAAEGGVAPLGLEGVAVESPFVEVGRGGDFADEDVLVDFGGLRAGVHGDDGDELFVGFVDAFVFVLAAYGVWGAGEAVVVHDAFDVARVVELGAGLLVVGAHPVVAWFLIGFDEDVVALADVDVEDVGLVGHDGDKVGGDDGELVAIDVELEGRLDGSVDDADQMSLAGLEIHLKARSCLSCAVVRAPHVHTVDEASVHDARSVFRSISDGLSEVVLRIDGFVAPILKDSIPSVDIVLGRARAVAGHGAEDTVVGLESEVRVVPSRAIVAGHKGVGHLLAWRKGTLRDGRHAIHLVGAEHAKTVEVKRCAVVLKLVLEVDHNGVAPAGFDERAGHLTVDHEADTRDAIGCNGGVRDGHVVLYSTAGLGGDLVAIVVDRVAAEVVGIVARLSIAGNAEVGFDGLGGACGGFAEVAVCPGGRERWSTWDAGRVAAERKGSMSDGRVATAAELRLVSCVGLGDGAFPDTCDCRVGQESAGSGNVAVLERPYACLGDDSCKDAGGFRDGLVNPGRRHWIEVDRG